MTEDNPKVSEEDLVVLLAQYDNQIWSAAQNRDMPGFMYYIKKRDEVVRIQYALYLLERIQSEGDRETVQ